MPLTPVLPAPLGPFAKVLLRALPFAWAAGEALVDYVTDADAVSDVQWRYVVLRFSRPTPVGTQEDYAQIGFNIVNITGGDIDTSWTSGDYTACEAALDEWWLGIDQFIDSACTLVDYRWYRRQFNEPMSDVQRFAASGPPERVTVKTLGGQLSGTSLPYQVALSVTLKTPVPRHWGRVYLPCIGATMIDASYARWGSGLPASVANYTHELCRDLSEGDFQLVVPSTQVNNVLSPSLLTVSDIQVDDIPDVIRRRRPRQPAVRSIGTSS